MKMCIGALDSPHFVMIDTKTFKESECTFNLPLHIIPASVLRMKMDHGGHIWILCKSSLDMRIRISVCDPHGVELMYTFLDIQEPSMGYIRFAHNTHKPELYIVDKRTKKMAVCDTSIVSWNHRIYNRYPKPERDIIHTFECIMHCVMLGLLPRELRHLIYEILLLGVEVTSPFSLREILEVNPEDYE